MPKYRGWEISQDENGFYWRHDGYFETLEACKASIDDYEAEQFVPPEDTPCLDPPWWAYR